MIADRFALDQEKEFKAALEEHYKVTNNPKKELLYVRAWELGHSAGLHEVEGIYDDLVDLIR
jgi:hypothetical protein